MSATTRTMMRTLPIGDQNWKTLNYECGGLCLLLSSVDDAEDKSYSDISRQRSQL